MRDIRRQSSKLKHRSATIAACMLVASLAACVSPSRKPGEYLDPDTAASVASVASPIVFARAHQDVAANSREYATVVGASVNRGGRYEYLLLVYLWSTVDPRLGAGRHPGDNLILLADDRAIRLQRDGRSPREAGIARPPDRPAHTRGPPRVYRIDPATLKFVADAHRLRLQLEGDGDVRPFEIWNDGRRELAQLANAAN